MKTVNDFLRYEVRTDTKDLLWGIDKLIGSLRPESKENSISVQGGFMRLVKYDGDNPPSDNDLVNEYNRQQGIAEFYNYLRYEQPEVFELLMKKLGYN